MPDPVALDRDPPQRHRRSTTRISAVGNQARPPRNDAWNDLPDDPSERDQRQPRREVKVALGDDVKERHDVGDRQQRGQEVRAGRRRAAERAGARPARGGDPRDHGEQREQHATIGQCRGSVDDIVGVQVVGPDEQLDVAPYDPRHGQQRLPEAAAVEAALRGAGRHQSPKHDVDRGHRRVGCVDRQSAAQAEAPLAHRARSGRAATAAAAARPPSPC